MTSEDNFKRLSCFRKNRFDTEAKALKKAREYNLRHYFCEICGGYHLTSKLNGDVKKNFRQFKNKKSKQATSTKEHKCYYCDYTILSNTKYTLVDMFVHKENQWNRFKFHSQCYSEMMDKVTNP